MSDEIETKLKRVAEIYQLLIAKPDPEQEEEAQKELSQIFTAIKEMANKDNKNYALIEDVYNRVKKWDALDKWFNEEVELKQKVVALLKEYNLSVESSAPAAKKEEPKPVAPTLAKTTVEQKAEENPEPVEVAASPKPVLRMKLSAPEIKIPPVMAPKRKITPSTSTHTPTKTEEPPVEKEPVENNEDWGNEVPKIKIQMGKGGTSPIKINTTPIKIVIPKEEEKVEETPQFNIKPVSAPNTSQTKPPSSMMPKIRPVNASPEIKPMDSAMPQIRPIGAPGVPQIKPVGAPGVPQIKPVGTSPFQIKPVGAVTLENKPAGPVPFQIKPVSTISQSNQDGNKPQIKPVGNIQKPQIRAMNPNAPNIQTNETPKPGFNLFAPPSGGQASNKPVPLDNSQVNVSDSKNGNKGINLFEKKPANLFAKPVKSESNGKSAQQNSNSLDAGLQKITPLEKIDYQNQVAPVLSVEDENFVKMSHEQLYYELLKEEAKRFFTDKLLAEVQQNYTKGQIVEAEFRGAKERHTFELEQHVKKINKIRSMIMAMK